VESQCYGNGGWWDFEFEDDGDYGAIIYLLCEEFFDR
jgi:hypothetical protein